MNDFLINLLISFGSLVLAIPFLYVYLNISDWYKNHIAMKVEYRIGWWLLSSGKDILDYIQNERVNKYIDTEFLINKESDRKIAFEIIKEFQAASKYLYLECNNRDTFDNRKLLKLNSSELLMYYFENYLSNHSYFPNDKLYVEKTKENNIIKCSITEYGIVYYKLFYMARLFCEKNSKLKNYKYYYSDIVKEHLDTKEIAFFIK